MPVKGFFCGKVHLWKPIERSVWELNWKLALQVSTQLACLQFVIRIYWLFCATALWSQSRQLIPGNIILLNSELVRNRCVSVFRTRLVECWVTRQMQAEVINLTCLLSMLPADTRTQIDNPIRKETTQKLFSLRCATVFWIVLKTDIKLIYLDCYLIRQGRWL